MEHEASYTKEGQPKPVLGKQQFETVAEGSKEFDRYLKLTLQGGDDEIAMRDRWRDDRFPDEANSVPPPAPSLTTAPSRASSSRVPAPAVTDSESEEEDEDDSEDEDDNDDDGNMKAASKKESSAGGDSSTPDNGQIQAEFEEFMRIKKMMEKQRKK